jgi:purine nucleosidase
MVANVRRLIIDTDAGVDDAMAILMALADPGCQVEAITTVSGNVPVSRVARNVAIVLDAAGAGSVPFYIGAARPLVGNPVDASGVHGSDGLGDAGFPESPRSPDPGHAAMAIVETARRLEGQCTLVALGPLTNVALALRLEPGLPGLLRDAVVMGGAFRRRGNVTPVAEFNIYADPEAAQVVFSSSLRPTVVSWDLTLEIPIPWKEWDELLATGLGARFVAPMTASLRSILQGRGLSGMLVPDPLAMAAALEPGAFEAREVWVGVETQGDLGRGLTALEDPPTLERPWNAFVAFRVDRSALLGQLRRAFGREANLA